MGLKLRNMFLEFGQKQRLEMGWETLLGEFLLSSGF